MKYKRIIVIVVSVVLAAMTIGFVIGGLNWYARYYSSPVCTSYVQDTWYSLQAIDDLGDHKSDEVMNNLRIKANSQVDVLYWIYQNAPVKSDRKNAYDLLVTISTNRNKYKISSRESKEGAVTHTILDEIEASRVERKEPSENRKK
ncbi:MAG: hypothetical protein HY343_00740 [Lentisphaerae bacterium]|nr:hypothetical protein [Lentisphaerota bacterium]